MNTILKNKGKLHVLYESSKLKSQRRRHRYPAPCGLEDALRIDGVTFCNNKILLVRTRLQFPGIRFEVIPLYCDLKQTNQVACFY